MDGNERDMYCLFYAMVKRWVPLLEIDLDGHPHGSKDLKTMIMILVEGTMTIVHIRRFDHGAYGEYIPVVWGVGT